MQTYNRWNGKRCFVLFDVPISWSSEGSSIIGNTEEKVCDVAHMFMWLWTYDCFLSFFLIHFKRNVQLFLHLVNIWCRVESFGWKSEDNPFWYNKMLRMNAKTFQMHTMQLVIIQTDFLNDTLCIFLQFLLSAVLTMLLGATESHTSLTNVCSNIDEYAYSF